MSKSKWERFIFGSDLHGDRQHKPTADAFLKFADLWEPHLRVFGGDLWDFRPLRKKADESERKESMRRDFEAGMDFLRSFKPDVFLLGNHDWRLWDLAEQGDGPLSDLASKLVDDVEKECRKLGTRIIPYHKRNGVFKVGHLKMVHGYAAGINAARKHAQVYGSVLHGHVHSIDHVTLERPEKTMARSVGCLCQLDMPYNHAILGSLRHAHGWAYGEVNKVTGDFHVYQAERVGNKFRLPMSIVEL